MTAVCLHTSSGGYDLMLGKRWEEEQEDEESPTESIIISPDSEGSQPRWSCPDKPTAPTRDT